MGDGGGGGRIEYAPEFAKMTPTDQTTHTYIQVSFPSYIIYILHSILKVVTVLAEEIYSTNRH